jgi:hypothetical protein
MIFEIAIITDTLVFLHNSLGTVQMGSAPMKITYFVIFIFGLVFQVILQVEGSKTKNTIQIIAVSWFNTLAVLFMIFQIRVIQALRICATDYVDIVYGSRNLNFDDLDNPSRLLLRQVDLQCSFNTFAPDANRNDPTAIAQYMRLHMSMFDRTLGFSIFMLIFLIIVTVAGFYFTYKTYMQYGWVIYKLQGADISRKWIVNRYHLFMLFLKINSYFFIGATSVYFSGGYFKDKGAGEATDVETDFIFFAVYSCFLVLVLVINYSAGYYAIHKCSPVLTAVFLATVGFYAYLIVGLYLDTESIAEAPSAVTWYYFFLSFQSICLLATIVLVIYLVLDMKRGLKNIIESIHDENKMEKRFSI